MAARKTVGASAVRSWFTALDADQRAALDLTDATVGDRGKIAVKIITAFEKETRQKYAAGYVEPVTVEGKREDSKGRKRSVKVTATLSEMRAWAQSPEAMAAGIKVGSRGRLSASVKEAFAARPKETAPVANVTDTTVTA